MPPGMCIYRMKPEICSLLLKRTPHCTCYLSRASNIWQLCVIVYQYYRDPLCGEQWGQRSRCENAPIYGGQRRRRGQKLACLVPLPSLGSRCTQTHSPCTQSLSRWVRIIQETQKSFLLDGKSSCSVWHTPAWIIYCLIFKKWYPCFRIALVQMSYLLLVLQDLF